MTALSLVVIANRSGLALVPVRDRDLNI